MENKEFELINRKEFFKKGVSGILSFITNTIEEKMKHFEYHPLRPPGAIPEEEFLKLCTKCNKCIESCSYQSIKKAGIEANIYIDYPIIEPSLKPCYMCEELSCINSCPEGALLLTEIEDIKIGIGEINQDKCITFAGKECDACVTSCPLFEEAIYIDEENDFPHPVITDKCTGCGLCQFWCNYKAITIKSIR